MAKRTWKDKIFSRKFLAAAAGVITGLAMVFGLDENIISTVAGSVTAVASVIAYIITEGKIDAESVKNATDAVQDAENAIKGSEDE